MQIQAPLSPREQELVETMGEWVDGQMGRCADGQMGGWADYLRSHAWAASKTPQTDTE